MRADPTLMLPWAAANLTLYLFAAPFVAAAVGVVAGRVE